MVAVILLALFACYRVYKVYFDKAPEVVTVPDISQESIQTAFPTSSKSEVKDITHQIERVREVQVPSYRWYSTNQAAADNRAQQYEKQDKADKVVKTTVEKTVKDENGKDTEQKVIENDYYAIQLERKHKIKMGAAVVDDDHYVTLSYQNRKIEYELYYSPDTQKYGAGVSYTVAQW